MDQRWDDLSLKIARKFPDWPLDPWCSKDMLSGGLRPRSCLSPDRTVAMLKWLIDNTDKQEVDLYRNQRIDGDTISCRPLHGKLPLHGKFLIEYLVSQPTLENAVALACAKVLEVEG